jgi:hypothetical protein
VPIDRTTDPAVPRIGFDIDPRTGVLSGTAVAGSHPLIVAAHAGDGRSAPRDAILIVLIAE